MTEWIPVALGRDLEAGSATGASVAGAAVALWRGSHGGVHAWADRCPHRGMRLSLGFVRDDRLVCLYHGWQFDAEGACRHIPAHPDISPPAAIRAHAYRVREQDAIVWVAGADGDREEPQPALTASAPADTATAACSVWVEAERGCVIDEISNTAEGVDLDDATVRAEVGGVPVIAGIQEVTAERTALHIAVRGPADADTVASVVHWAHGLRDDVHRSRTSVAAS